MIKKMEGGEKELYEKMEQDMCDKNARIWTCRIGLLITVCSVLCLMIFQIWTYYFSLVSQMDTLTFASPEIQHIVKWWPNGPDGSDGPWSFSTWNVENCQVEQQKLKCTLLEPLVSYFVDSHPGNSVLNGTTLTMELTGAGVAKVWKLPWGNSL